MGKIGISRRNFLRWGAGAVICGTGSALGYGFGIEPHWVEVVNRNLPIRGLPASLAGSRLVQISDLHIGPQVAESYPAVPNYPLSRARPNNRSREVDNAGMLEAQPPGRAACAGLGKLNYQRDRVGCLPRRQLT